MMTFQEMLKKLTHFWEKKGCIIHQGYDLETGAGTFNPVTFLRCLGPEPYKAMYFEQCRRPSDGRYGTNPNRVQNFFQGQVIMKPSPPDILELCLESLEAIGFDLKQHDMRFVHDDWESPTLGAWGLGWEVWMDGMEITQFTYFQSLGGVSLKPVTAEITYGLERLALYLQKVDSIFDLQYNDELTYGDIYFDNEVQWSHYNFEKANAEMWFKHFEDFEQETKRIIAEKLPIPAYDFVIKASHAFNILDARGLISVTERTGYIARIRDLAREIAESYMESRNTLNYPLLKRFGKLSETNHQESHSQKEFTKELLDRNPDKSEDFLLEIGSEELPATFVPIGIQNLEKAMKQLLAKEGLRYKSLRVDGTPRRLMVYIEELAMGKADIVVERKGPLVKLAFDDSGKPSPAGEGFFRSIEKKPLNLEAIQNQEDPDVTIISIKGSDYLSAKQHIPGCATATLLAEQIPALILNLEFPKKMRWGDLDITYARPLRWITALFGSDIVPLTVGDLHSDRFSWGHRQLSHKKFSIQEAKNYFSQLREHHVMISSSERKETILKELENLEKELGGHAVAKSQVMPYVVNMVEWPQVTYSSFNKDFLKIPKEVLTSEMVEHQKYFPMENEDGSLKNNFIITANTTPTDSIREGNQKVLSARLNDGVFLYEQGIKVPLEKLNEKLKAVTFQKKLGSVYEKVCRIKKHASILQKALKISSEAQTERAAELCKADLASEMVYEFPDLQGVIGYNYALAQGEDPEVAQAIKEHWMPCGEHGTLPQSEIGLLISLADKIDNIIGCFAVDLKPTSSSDPYALRRQTLGMIKMLIETKNHLPLMATFKACFANFPLHLQTEMDKLLTEIEAFIVNRLKTIFLDYHFNKDEIEAAVSFGFHDVYESFCKVQALHNFRKKDNKFSLLYEVYKRAKGQLNEQQTAVFSSQLLTEDAEKSLDRLLIETENPFAEAIASCNYDLAYSLIATLQPALAELFEKVKILDGDPKIRENRLALLQKVFNRFSRLLDFSKIQI